MVWSDNLYEVWFLGFFITAYLLSVVLNLAQHGLKKVFTFHDPEPVETLYMHTAEIMILMILTGEI